MEGARQACGAGGADHEAKVITCCRRALAALADLLCPASSAPKRDRFGVERAIGEHQFKNRLLHFLDQAALPPHERTASDAELKLLATRLDGLADRLQKGVHDDATAREARWVFSRTWSVIVDLHRAAVA